MLEKKTNQNTTISKDREHNNTLRMLQEKDVFYLKADKGNAIVVLDTQEYYERVNTMLKEGPYKVCSKNPLKKYSSLTSESLRKCKILINTDTYKKLNVTNPVLPRLYCLPKVHKAGKQMRPIVSSINSPTYFLSKWLKNKLQNLQNYPSFSVKNRYEFINSVKNIHLENDEYLVSFDVIGLYPNVPIETTRILIKDWLMTTDLPKEEIEEYVILINLCMNQTTFQFQNLYYSQINGTTMGNPLSCLIANVFMSHFEVLAKQSLSYFPRIWLRYVDDVFAIFNKNEDILNFVQQLNSFYPSIKFTHEVEVNNKIPFLDTLVIRRSHSLEFDIYRKPTHTDRYITNDSYHPHSQKRAAFHSLVFRLLNTPLSEEKFKKELEYIKNVSKFNGYTPTLIDNMIRKAKRKQERRKRTTLNSIKEKSNDWISTTYSTFSKTVQKTFKKHTTKNIAFKTNNNLKKKLSNPKNKIKQENMSGIYQISCSTCNRKYIGQTRRNIKTRFKEHYSHIKYNRPEKSAVAHHCLHTGHIITDTDLKLLKQITSQKHLNAWETYYINLSKDEELLNNEEGPIQNSPLLQPEFIKQFQL